jgi:hypothetical protein
MESFSDWTALIAGSGGSGFFIVMLWLITRGKVCIRIDTMEKAEKRNEDLTVRIAGLEEMNRINSAEFEARLDEQRKSAESERERATKANERMIAKLEEWISEKSKDDKTD